MAETVERPWSDEQLKSDDLGKREIITFLQSHSSKEFLAKHKLLGSAKNAMKICKKEGLIVAYNELFETKAFGEGAGEKLVAAVTEKVKSLDTKDSKSEEVKEIPKFQKSSVLKKGDKVNFPKPGDKVKCYYIGKLGDGTVFDSLQPGTKKKKNQPLQFKVGKGNVIKGWDQALLTMSVGEKCEVVIEPEWAYGKAGKPEAKIPSNATLHFEIDLVAID